MSTRGVMQDSTLRIWRRVRDAGKAGVVVGRLVESFPALDPEAVRSAVNNLRTRGFVVQPGGKATPYFVDEDCRVPVGESAKLGPGWEEETSDSAAPASAPAVQATRPAPPAAAAVNSVFALAQSLAGDEPDPALDAASPAQAPEPASAPGLGWKPTADFDGLKVPQTADIEEPARDPTAPRLNRPSEAVDRITVRSLTSINTGGINLSFGELPAGLPFRAGLHSDGTLQRRLESGVTVELSPDETRGLFRWLDQLTGLGMSDLVLPEAA